MGHCLPFPIYQISGTSNPQTYLSLTALWRWLAICICFGSWWPCLSMNQTCSWLFFWTPATVQDTSLWGLVIWLSSVFTPPSSRADPIPMGMSISGFSDYWLLLQTISLTPLHPAGSKFKLSLCSVKEQFPNTWPIMGQFCWIYSSHLSNLLPCCA